MTDRSVQYPTRYRMTKVEGTDDIYEMEPVPGEVTDEGTIINKTALLKDTTAALFGFTAEQIPDTVPDDVLVLLKTMVDNAQAGADASTKIVLGSYTGTGTYGSANPCKLTFASSPKFLFVYSKIGIFLSTDVNTVSYSINNYFIWAPGLTLAYASNFIGSKYGTHFAESNSGKTISWYSAYSVADQLNEQTEYGYVALL